MEHKLIPVEGMFCISNYYRNNFTMPPQPELRQELLIEDEMSADIYKPLRTGAKSVLGGVRKLSSMQLNVDNAPRAVSA